MLFIFNTQRNDAVRCLYIKKEHTGGFMVAFSVKDKYVLTEVKTSKFVLEIAPLL